MKPNVFRIITTAECKAQRILRCVNATLRCVNATLRCVNTIKRCVNAISKIPEVRKRRLRSTTALGDPPLQTGDLKKSQQEGKDT